MHRSRTLLPSLAITGTFTAQQAMRQQFGAICYRSAAETKELEVLLITTRESRRWTIPKGWPMDGKAPHQVAKREAFEEAGVSGKVSKKAFGYYTYLKCLADGQKIACVVEVHLLHVANLLDAYKEQGQRKLLWCSCFEAAVKVGEPELKGLFRLLYERPGSTHL